MTDETKTNFDQDVDQALQIAKSGAAAEQSAQVLPFPERPTQPLQNEQADEEERFDTKDRAASTIGVLGATAFVAAGYWLPQVGEALNKVLNR